MGRKPDHGQCSPCSPSPQNKSTPARGLEPGSKAWVGAGRGRGGRIRHCPGRRHRCRCHSGGCHSSWANSLALTSSSSSPKKNDDASQTGASNDGSGPVVRPSVTATRPAVCPSARPPAGSGPEGRSKARALRRAARAIADRGDARPGLAWPAYGTKGRLCPAGRRARFTTHPGRRTNLAHAATAPHDAGSAVKAALLPLAASLAASPHLQQANRETDVRAAQGGLKARAGQGWLRGCTCPWACLGVPWPGSVPASRSRRAGRAHRRAGRHTAGR